MKGLAPLIPYFLGLIVFSIPIFVFKPTSFIGKTIRLFSGFVVVAGFALLANAADGDAKRPSTLGLFVAIPYFFCWIGQVFARRGWPIVEMILSVVACKVAYAYTNSLMASVLAALVATVIVAAYTVNKAPIRSFVED